jgi:hypothetical protein
MRIQRIRIRTIAAQEHGGRVPRATGIAAAGRESQGK